MDTASCIEGIEEAIQRYGTPDVFNTDQGAQFTSLAFTDMVKRHAIQFSMDGKGSWRDNVFVERLWRTVKYKEAYLKAYETISDAKTGLSTCFGFYKKSRRAHSVIGRQTPDQVYFKELPVSKAA